MKQINPAPHQPATQNDTVGSFASIVAVQHLRLFIEPMFSAAADLLLVDPDPWKAIEFPTRI